MPSVLGELNGKAHGHQMSKKRWKLVFIYNSFYPIVVLALVDVNYQILWMDVSSSGSWSDSDLQSV